MTMPTVYHRIFDRLNELVPHLSKTAEGSAFYGSPKQANDMAIYLQITKVNGNYMELEVTHGQVVHGEDQPAPWMVFRVDFVNATAEILAVEDSFRYEIIYTPSNLVNPRRAPMNLFALNWLTILYHTQSNFTPINLPMTVQD